MWPDCAANSRPKLLIFRTPSLYFPADSSVDPDNAMLIYKAVFDCWPRVKVSVNLTRDAVTPKLASYDLKRLSEAGPSLERSVTVIAI